MKLPSLNLKVPNPYKRSAELEVITPNLQIGPGPSNYSAAVANALCRQPVTFINEDFYKVLDETKELLQYVYQTRNRLTFISQTSGNGGNELTVVNLADPGETIIVATSGIWGQKVADMGRRYKLNVVELTTEQGEVYSFKELEVEIIKHKPVAFYITHGESSGGTLQPLDGLGEICHKYNCLLVVDAVVTVGIVPVLVDEWQIDAVAGATQKGIGAPAGMSLMSFSDRAYEKIKSKKHPVPYIYDITTLGGMWNGLPNSSRRYLYTFGFHMLSCIRQALREICAEGLEKVWARHQAAADMFDIHVQKLGMTYFVEKPQNRFCGVICVVLPKDAKWPLVADYLLHKCHIEVGYGIGATKGKALRVGFLANSARPEVVEVFAEALEEAIDYARANPLQLKKCSVVKNLTQWGNTFYDEKQTLQINGVSLKNFEY